MYKYFKNTELKCKCGICGSLGLEMNVKFMMKLEAIREKCGFPLVLSSAYRCPEYNLKVAKSGTTGPHTTGHAVDVVVSMEQAYWVTKYAFEEGMTGFGIQQKGTGRYLHLDDLKAPEFLRPRIYSY